jgi:hypothetical protein
LPENQKPRCKQRDIKLAALQSSGVFDPRGIRQISMQTWLFFSLLAGIKIEKVIDSIAVLEKREYGMPLSNGYPNSLIGKDLFISFSQTY